MVWVVIAYIDESKAKSYILAVCLAQPKEISRLRKTLSTKLLKGQRSFHFRKESDRRRVQLVRFLLEFDFKVVIFRDTGRSVVQARKTLITQVCATASKFGITELVFELDNSAWESDIKLLNELRPSMPWDHRERHQEPLLWVADAVAWCVNRGGEWERMVRPLILETIEC